MKKNIYEIVFSVLLGGFTVFILLDTFVISSVYQTNTTAMNTSLFEETARPEITTEEPVETVSPTAVTPIRPAGDNSSRRSRSHNPGNRTNSELSEPTESPLQEIGTEIEIAASRGSWQDENITIDITEYTYKDSAVYAADIQLSSAQYLKTAFADDKFGKNITAATSAIAAANDGILAINGDFYGAQERGYVIRNGIIYRDIPSDADVLCIYADGSMEIIDPAEVSAQELAERGAWQTFSFGPALIENGIITAGIDEEVGRAMASNPRTAIGIIDDLHFVFIVSDGRTEESEGLSLYELAQFMEQLGVTTGYNLDGGGSSTMVFEGNVINIPTTNGRIFRERGVSDIVYIG